MNDKWPKTHDSPTLYGAAMLVSDRRLRRALPADLPDLVDMDASSHGGGWRAESFAQELDLEWSRVMVAECEGSLVGFVVYWLTATDAEILNIAVHPSARRCGLGRYLLLHVVDAARAKGALRVLLEVRCGNEPARGLYRAFGFVEDSVRRQYYADREDAVLMTYQLCAAPCADAK